MLLFGCSGKTNNDVLKENEIQINDSVIALNEVMDEALEELDSNYELTESKSCLYDGYDKTYSFDDLVIVTYPSNNHDYISSIKILSEKINIFKDIHIGQSIDDLYRVMGENYVVNESYLCTYEYQDFGLAFYLENNQITQIELYLLQ